MKPSNWAELRARLKSLQDDWQNAVVTLKIPQNGWHPIGLDALGFKPDPPSQVQMWTYTFDRTPPDPNG